MPNGMDFLSQDAHDLLHSSEYSCAQPNRSQAHRPSFLITTADQHQVGENSFVSYSHLMQKIVVSGEDRFAINQHCDLNKESLRLTFLNSISPSETASYTSTNCLSDACDPLSPNFIPENCGYDVCDKNSPYFAQDKCPETGPCSDPYSDEFDPVTCNVDICKYPGAWYYNDQACADDNHCGDINDPLFDPTACGYNICDDSASRFYDPVECDSCHEENPNFDPAQCEIDICSDPSKGYYDPTFCNPEGPVEDPCDPSNSEYDACSCGDEESCNPEVT
jgi:hypothetical protein